MTGPIVPLELQYRTIELVWDRQYTVFQATLRSCALTCRAWLVPSRRRLFRSLVLGPLNRQEQVDVLASFISASRDVSEAVEQLIIITDDGHFSTSTPPGYVRPQVIAIILAAKFPRLRSLVIHSENKVSSFPDHMRIFAAVSTITSLRLQSIRVDVRALRKMLAMFPSLQEISIINLRRTSSRDAPTLMSLPLRLPHLTHIEAMQCEAFGGDDVLSYLLRMACGTLEYLDVQCYDSDEYPEAIFSSFCQVLPPGLDYPRLSTFKHRKDIGYGRWGVYTILRRVMLSSVLALLSAHARRLQTVILSYGYCRGTLLPISEPMKIISSAPRPPQGLENLLSGLKILKMTPGPHGDLDEQLSSKFGNLERVELEFIDNLPLRRRVTQHELRIFVTSLREEAIALFPKLSLRNLLDVTFVARDGRHVWCRWVDNGAEIEGIPLSNKDPLGITVDPKW